MDRIRKVREKSSKTAGDVKNDFSKMEKLKAESLKKTEEMRRTSEQDLEKIEREIAKDRDLAPESRQRLIVELGNAKNETQQEYAGLKTRISKAIVPE
jgi:predicted phage gp36 major capsid-like protein